MSLLDDSEPFVANGNPFFWQNYKGTRKLVRVHSLLYVYI